MSKLDVWRWAQYTLVGLLLASLIICTLLPDHGQGLVAKISHKQVLPVTLAIVAFGGYIVGMIAWVVIVALSKVVTWPVFFVFRPLSKSTRSYREYRMMELKLQAAELHQWKADISNDIPDYTHFLLELYRSSEAHPQYLGGKVVSAWQSCTLILSVVGSLMFGMVLSFGRLLVMLFVSEHDAVVFQLCLFLALVFLYFLAGLALLSRNRLLVRDVLMSYVLRKERNAQPECPDDKQ
jgi:hypothetical protein